MKTLALALLLAVAAIAQPVACTPAIEENGFYLSPTGEALDRNCKPTGWSFERTVLFTFGWSLDKTKTVDLSNWINASDASASKAAAVIAKLAPDATPKVVRWNYPGCFDLGLWPTSSICYSKPISLIVLWPSARSVTSQWTADGYPLIAGLVANTLMRGNEAALAAEIARLRNVVLP